MAPDDRLPSKHAALQLATAALLFGAMSHAAEPAGTRSSADASRVCELAARRGGLVQYAVQVEPDKEGNRTVKADMDGDGSDDQLRWSDAGAGSTVPEGNSTLTLTLSSAGGSFTLQQQRIRVIKFESNYFVVTTRIVTGLGPWEREVYSINKEGFTRTCALSGKGQAP